MDLGGLKGSGQHRVQDWSKIVFADLGGFSIWQPSRAESPSPAEPGRAVLAAVAVAAAATMMVAMAMAMAMAYLVVLP